MKIRIFPGDQTGCGFYRCMEPGRVVSELSADVEVEYVYHELDDGGLEVTLAGRLGNERVVGVRDPECDVIVLQRPAHRHLVESIPHIQRYGTAVVVDFDDDFDSLHPRNQAYPAYDPEHNPLQNKIWAKLASSLADLVTVTTPALAKTYGEHGRVAVLRNYVPESYLTVKPFWPEEYATKRPHIGWAGNPFSHPGDLEVMGSAIHDLTFDRRARFCTIGSAKTGDIVSARHPKAIPWSKLSDYPALTASFDVGVVPLADTKFNRAKSWLKGLEYAALGVPFVASPTQQYKALAEFGMGDTVRTTTRNSRAWTDALLRFVEDEEYRQLRSEEGRILAGQFTYEKNGFEWLQAWGNALSMRRAT